MGEQTPEFPDGPQTEAAAGAVTSLVRTHAAASGPENPGDFVQEAVVRLRAAQGALTEVLAGAGLGGAKPTEVGRALGLDKSLAWKISRFVGDQDPAQAVRHMPGQGGVEIVLKAAALRGVDPKRVESARERDRLLRAFVANAAGDRRSFEAMLASGGRDERVEFDERRAFYRAAATIWGVRAKLQFLMIALRPSATADGMLDVVQVSGFVGFERLRPDVPWILRRLRVLQDSGERRDVAREPLDPTGVRAGGGMALMPGHCTHPMPEIRQFVGDNGWVYDEIAPGEVGRRGAVTCVAGEIYREALPYRWSEDNREGRYKLTVRTPVEGVVFDVLLHESLGAFGHPETRVAGLIEDRPSRTSAGGTTSSLLYEPAPAMTLGRPASVPTPRMAEYGDVVSGALSLAGWEGLESFRGYRMDIDYPPAPSELAVVAPISPE